jgi:hypothetical protein
MPDRGWGPVDCLLAANGRRQFAAGVPDSWDFNNYSIVSYRRSTKIFPRVAIADPEATVQTCSNMVDDYAPHHITGAFLPDFDGFAFRPQQRASAAAMEWRRLPIVARNRQRTKGRECSTGRYDNRCGAPQDRREYGPHDTRLRLDRGQS